MSSGDPGLSGGDGFSGDPDVAEVAAALAAADRPWLIGVRHHSPHMAVAVPTLLDRFAPDHLFLELPADLQEWVTHLAHPDLVPPVALAAVDHDGGQLGFWPFADFSPELVAVRWARAHDVPVTAFDLPVGARRAGRDMPPPTDAGPGAPTPDSAETGPPETGLPGSGAPSDGDGDGPSSGARLRANLLRAGGRQDPAGLWDDLVEARAPGSDPEAIRQAGLVVGWAMRRAEALDGFDPLDLARERHMREVLEGHDARRPVALVGSFHAAALVGIDVGPAIDNEPNAASTPPATPSDRVVTSSLLPYHQELFDSRSGYPAGVPDPAWQQRVWAAAGDVDAIDHLTASVLTEICVELRRAGHVAGAPDAREALRVALDLTRIRDLPAPGRRELLEAVTTTLGQGEPVGRARALAVAAQSVLVGNKRGRLAPDTPRSGLLPQVEALLDDLNLPRTPGRAGERTDLRLDVSRTRIDRRRHITLARMAATGVSYAEETAVAGTAGVQALTRRWSVGWTPATEAGLDHASMWGPTLTAAAEGSLRTRWSRAERDESLGPATVLALLTAAAEAGLSGLTHDLAATLVGSMLTEAGLEDLLAGHLLLHRLRAGGVPGLQPNADEPRHPADPQPLRLPATLDAAPLLGAAVAAVEGLAGSDDAAEVRRLADLLAALDLDPEAATQGRSRLRHTLGRFAAGEASPLVQGAAMAALAVLDSSRPGEPSSLAQGEEPHPAVVPLERLGAAAGSWIEGGDRRETAARLRGLLTMAAPLLETAPAALDELAEALERLADTRFVTLLPGLRHGFEALSAAGRDRFLAAVAERLDLDGDELNRSLVVDIDPELAARALAFDAAGRSAVAGLDPSLLPAAESLTDSTDPVPTTSSPSPATSPAPSVPSAVQSTTAEPVEPTSAEADQITADADQITALDRWRLVLGRQREQLPPHLGPMARSLDQLYGRGHGEGSSRPAGRRSGQGEAQPTAREWADDLEEIFGSDVREEVLGRAAEAGRADVLTELDPDSVTPSVELLEQVLALRGASGEAHLTRLRALVKKIVDQLARELATSLRPSLRGLALPRATRRPGGPVDLDRTIAANLHTARRNDDGKVVLAPDRLRYRARADRHLDWHIHLVVDVSGSMDASVIHSALMAAILSGLPALSVRMTAFSTTAIDLTDRVDDPLALLLDVSVGGGTDIGLGLRYARAQVTVPRRTIVVVVSDFEEGMSVGRLLAEVRSLVSSGVTALGLAALDDRGQPEFNRAIAAQVAAAGMPVAALSPSQLVAWVVEQVNR